jgi:nucleotide-binding universal stress UspA family protein
MGHAQDIGLPTARLRAAVQAEEAAKAEKLAALLDALAPDSGIPQKDVVEVTGLSREQVRRIAREHGIGPARTGPKARNE